MEFFALFSDFLQIYFILSKKHERCFYFFGNTIGPTAGEPAGAGTAGAGPTGAGPNGARGGLVASKLICLSGF